MIQPLVPHDPAHKQEDGNAVRQAISAGDSDDLCRGDGAQGQIHTVGHDDAFAFIAHGSEIVRCPGTDGPHLIAGTDVLYQSFGRAGTQQLAPHHLTDFNVELCVVGHDQGRVRYTAQLPAQNRGGNGAVGMQQSHLSPVQLPGDHGRKGNTCRIASGHFPEIQTGVTDDRIRKSCIIALRVGGSDDYSVFPSRMDVIRIVFDCIGNTVNNRREGIVQQANGISVFHSNKTPMFVIVSCQRGILMPFKNTT